MHLQKRRPLHWISICCSVMMGRYMGVFTSQSRLHGWVRGNMSARVYKGRKGFFWVGCRDEAREYEYREIRRLGT